MSWMCEVVVAEISYFASRRKSTKKSVGSVI